MSTMKRLVRWLLAGSTPTGNPGTAAGGINAAEMKRLLEAVESIEKRLATIERVSLSLETCFHDRNRKLRPCIRTSHWSDTES